MAKNAQINIEIKGNLNKELKAVNSELDILNKSLDKTNDEIKSLEEKQDKQSKARVKQLKKEQKLLKDDIKLTNTSQKEIKESLGLISSLENKMADLGEAKRLATSTDEIAALNVELEATQSKLDDISGNKEESKGIFGGLINGAKEFGATMLANPGLLVIAAITAALKFVYDAFSKSEEGANKLAEGFAYIQGYLIPLKKAAMDVGRWFVRLFEDPIPAMKEFGKLLFDQIFNRVKGLIMLLPRLTIALGNLFTGDFDAAAKGAADAFLVLGTGIENATEKLVDYNKEAAVTAAILRKLAKEEAKLEKQRRTSDITQAKRLFRAEELKNIRDDESVSIKARIKSNEELNAVIKRGLEEEIFLKEWELRIARDRAEQAGSTVESDTLREIAELEAELLTIREDAASKQNEYITNSVGLRKEQYEETEKLLEKEKDRASFLITSSEEIYRIEKNFSDKKLKALEKNGLKNTQLYADELKSREDLTTEYYKTIINETAAYTDEISTLIESVTGSGDISFLSFIDRVKELGLTTKDNAIEPLKLMFDKIQSLRGALTNGAIDITKFNEEVEKLSTTDGLIREIIGEGDDILNKAIFANVDEIDDVELSKRLEGVADKVMSNIDVSSGSFDRILESMGMSIEEFNQKYDLTGEFVASDEEIEKRLREELDLYIAIEKEKILVRNTNASEASKKATKIANDAAADEIQRGKNTKEENAILKAEELKKNEEAYVKAKALEDKALADTKRRYVSQLTQATDYYKEEEKLKKDLEAVETSLIFAQTDSEKKRLEERQKQIKYDYDLARKSTAEAQAEATRLQKQADNFKLETEEEYQSNKQIIIAKYSSENIRNEEEVEKERGETVTKIKDDVNEEILVNEEEFASTMLKLQTDYLKKKVDAEEEANEKIIQESEELLKDQLSKLAALESAYNSVNTAMTSLFDPTSMIAFGEAMTTVLDKMTDDLAGVKLTTEQIVESIAEATSAVANGAFSIMEDSLDRSLETSLNKVAESTEETTAILDDAKKQGLITEEQYNDELAEIESQRIAQINQLELQAFLAQKQNDKAQATMNGALAVTKAFAQLGPIGGAIATALIGTMTAIQLGAINNQKFTPIRAKTGDVVQGDANTNRDSVPYLLAPGESVINSESTSMFLPLLSMMNEIGGGKQLTNTPTADIFDRNTAGSSNEPTRAYVVESDITSKQNYVGRIERDSEY